MIWITAVQFDSSGHHNHEHIRAVRWRDAESQQQGQYTVAEAVDLIRAQTLVYVSDDAFERTALGRSLAVRKPAGPPRLSLRAERRPLQLLRR